MKKGLHTAAPFLFSFHTEQLPCPHLCPMISTEQRFLHETIAQWAMETELLLQMQVVKKGLVMTEALLRSISYQIVKEALGVRYDLSFNDYGRILDMNRQKVSSRNLNRRVLLGGKEVKVRRNGNNTKWYSKNIYRQIYGNDGLFDRIQNNYQAWAMEQVIASLEGRKT